MSIMCRIFGHKWKTVGDGIGGKWICVRGICDAITPAAKWNDHCESCDTILEENLKLKQELKIYTGVEATLKRGKLYSDNKHMRQFIEDDGLLRAFTLWKEAEDMTFFEKEQQS